MVVGIFIYVGAEVCISTQVPTYLKDKFEFDLKTWAIVGTAIFALGILVGRFLGSVVLRWMSPAKFLLATVLVMIVGVAGLLLAPVQEMAIVSIIVAGLGCANIFPLVFSITVNHMPQRTNEIAGLMVTAIVGGAILPPLMGLLADAAKSVSMGFLVPLLCGVYLLVLAFVSLKQAATPAKSS